MAKREINCPTCQGSGECIKCGGTGEVRNEAGKPPERHKTDISSRPMDKKTITHCPECQGTGKCHACHGSGKTEVE